jgi:hypothetical protein
MKLLINNQVSRLMKKMEGQMSRQDNDFMARLETLKK